MLRVPSEQTAPDGRNLWILDIFSYPDGFMLDFVWYRFTKLSLCEPANFSGQKKRQWACFECLLEIGLDLKLESQYAEMQVGNSFVK